MRPRERRFGLGCALVTPFAADGSGRPAAIRRACAALPRRRLLGGHAGRHDRRRSIDRVRRARGDARCAGRRRHRSVAARAGRDCRVGDRGCGGAGQPALRCGRSRGAARPAVLFQGTRRRGPVPVVRGRARALPLAARGDPLPHSVADAGAAFLVARSAASIAPFREWSAASRTRAAIGRRPSDSSPTTRICTSWSATSGCSRAPSATAAAGRSTASRTSARDSCCRWSSDGAEVPGIAELVDLRAALSGHAGRQSAGRASLRRRRVPRHRAAAGTGRRRGAGGAWRGAGSPAFAALALSAATLDCASGGRSRRAA